MLRFLKESSRGSHHHLTVRNSYNCTSSHRGARGHSATDGRSAITVLFALTFAHFFKIPLQFHSIDTHKFLQVRRSASASGPRHCSVHDLDVCSRDSSQWGFKPPEDAAPIASSKRFGRAVAQPQRHKRGQMGNAEHGSQSRTKWRLSRPCSTTPPPVSHIECGEINDWQVLEQSALSSANWRVDCSRVFFVANLAFLTLISAVVKS